MKVKWTMSLIGACVNRFRRINRKYGRYRDGAREIEYLSVTAATLPAGS